MKVKLGQNFLKDNTIALREINYAKIKNNDYVLEIGPGNGILTKLLTKKAKKVTAIEYDKKLYDKLKKELPETVDLLLGDAVKVDFKKIKFNKICANLPFQISSPITFKFLKYNFDNAVLIYQKDFAERMVAMPGSKKYSHLSVHLYYTAYCEILEILPKNCFKPRPKVDAAMVRLFPLNNPPFTVQDENFFLKLSRNLFNYRRKMIKSILKKIYSLKDMSNIPFKQQRVEDLSPQQIGELSDILIEKI